MDPNLFYLDWERLSEVMVAIIILAFLIERALAWLFELDLYKRSLSKLKLKPYIALLVSFFICWYWNFDSLSIIFVKDSTTLVGVWITAAIIAGGSKGAIELFKKINVVKEETQNPTQGTTAQNTATQKP